MYDAFVVALAVFIGVAGHEMFGMSMLSRPIVVAPLAGALMGFADGVDCRGVTRSHLYGCRQYRNL